MGLFITFALMQYFPRWREARLPAQRVAAADGRPEAVPPIFFHKKS